jgi:hypothetical protein
MLFSAAQRQPEQAARVAARQQPDRIHLVAAAVAALDGVDVMTLSELITWHRGEGIAAWKKYEHALTHGLKSAARFRRAFNAHGETVEALTELHCRRRVADPADPAA